MKLVTYASAGGGARLGGWTPHYVVDLQSALGAFLAPRYGPGLAAELARARLPLRMVDYLQAGSHTWSAGQQAFTFGVANDGPWRLPHSAARLLAPLQPPVLIMGGANFYDHLDETQRGKPDEVEFFLKATAGIIGPGQPAAYDPQLSRKWDYEVEIGIVIGKPAFRVAVEDAFDYIFGYTIVNDICLRDQQIIPWDDGRFQIRFGEGKSFTTNAPVGPWIVTRDELPDVSALGLKTLINDEVRQNNSLANIIWDVPHLVSYYSQFMTLQPGFLLASGTPGGPALGWDVELGANPYARDDIVRAGYMSPGDMIHMEVEGVGALDTPLLPLEGE